MKKSLLLIVCLCTLLFSGCGDKVGVKGTVKFTDGTPLTTGEVQFLTPTYVASGTIQPDGTYVISSLKEGDGIPKGKYGVAVRANESAGSSATLSAEDAKPLMSLIDLKYNSPDTSDLTCDVQGATVFDITVEPFKK